MRTILPWLFGACGVVGCNAVLGIDDRPGRPAASAAGGSPGAGAGSSSVTSGSSGGAGAAAGGIGGAGGAGGGGGGTMLSGPCGKTMAFADDFDDGLVHKLWLPLPGAGSVAEIGGQLELAFVAGAQPAAPAYYTRNTLDLRGSQVWVEVIDVALDGSATTRLLTKLNDDNELSIEHRDGMVHFTWKVASVGGGTSTTYDPAVHRWWRIREQADVVSWETSADALDWTTQHQMAMGLLFSVEHVRTRLEVSSPAATIAAAAHFDNFNGGAAANPFCKASKVSDAFDGAFPSYPFFAGATGACALQLLNEELQMLSTDVAQLCAFTARSVFDLKDSAWFVELAQAPTNGGLFGGIEITNRSQAGGPDAATFGVRLGALRYETIAAGVRTQVEQQPFDAANHRWLRVREQGGLLNLEVSADGVAWSTSMDHPPPFDLHGVELSIRAVGESNVAVPAEVRFDNLNVQQ